MTVLAPVATSAAPVPMDRGLAASVADLRNAVFGGEIAATAAPSDALRSTLVARCRQLDRWLAAASPGSVDVDLGALLGIMPSRRSDEDDATFALGLYAAALSGLPRFAISAACASLLRTGGGSRHWVPTPPEVRARAEQEVARWHAERAEIARILDAKVSKPRSTPEVRARLAAEARRAFHIPEPPPAGRTTELLDDRPDDPGPLAGLAREILLRSGRRPRVGEPSGQPATEGASP